jgi:hypothetical protein
MACLGGAGVCDSAGQCVECLTSADCVTAHPTDPICDLAQHTCVSCSDGIENGQETGVDCGGPDCGACLGDACAMNMYGECGDMTTCVKQAHDPDNVCCSTPCTGICEGCVTATTGLPDGTCGPVPFGMDPYMDCTQAGTPMAGGCGKAPNTCACSDLIKDGDETDVDCGGGTCPGCGGGKMCSSANDCAADFPNCTKGVCCNSACGATCYSCNSVGECVAQPVGFGDPTCPPDQACAPLGTAVPNCIGKAGASCTANGFCLSQVCTAGHCAKSASGGACNTTADCATGTCTNFTCM